MSRSQIFYLAISAFIFFTSCKKDEGLTEEQSASYMKYYGAASTGSDMAPTDDGGFIMVGTISSGASDDILLVKTDEYGNQQWLKTFDGPDLNDDEGNAVVVTPDGGYAIIGTTTDTFIHVTPTGSFDVEVRKGILFVTDKFGSPVTSPRLFGFGDSTSGFKHDVYGNGISMDNTGSNFIIAGEIKDRIKNDNTGYGLLISSTNYSQSGIIYCLLEDLNGEIINIGFNDVIQASNDHYIFVGNTVFTQVSTQAKSNIWITDYEVMNNTDISGVGNFYVIGGSEDDDAYSVIENSNGNYVISGYITEDVDGRSDKNAAIIENKAPASDGPLWESTFGEEISSSFSEDIAYGCFALTDGYIVAGITQRPGEEGQLYLVRLNSTGEKLWTKNYGFIGMDEARTVSETSDGGYALFGTATDERGNATMCMIKTSSSGELK